ncbi:hypothetical protein C8R44DRAFT_794458 [Mycena epipterygia]|nr:hypothetical protein C8R44DRAFT_794458 [Mycena epipterygia]
MMAVCYCLVHCRICTRWNFMWTSQLAPSSPGCSWLPSSQFSSRCHLAPKWGVLTIRYWCIFNARAQGSRSSRLKYSKLASLANDAWSNIAADSGTLQ